MRALKDVVEEKKELIEAKNLTEVFEEITAGKMRGIRQGIIKSREFYDGLAVFSEEIGADLGISKPGTREASLFIASATGLYGEIIQQIFFDFLKFAKENKSDIIIVGRMGVDLIRAADPSLKYAYFDMPDDKIDMDRFNEIMRSLVGYKKVYVFHGRFVNLARQNPATTAISGEMVSKMPRKGDSTLEKLTYIYEPSVEAISKILIDEILSSVFEQLLRESQLARFGAKLMSLNESIDNMGEKINEAIAEKRRLRKILLGKKQNSMISGLAVRGGI